MYCATYDEQNVELPSHRFHGNTSHLSNHGVESKGQHRGNRDTLGTRLCVKDLGRDDPGQRPASRTEAEVVGPGDDDEAPRSGLVVGRAWRKGSKQDGRNDESHHISEIAKDERPATSEVIDEEDAEELRNEGNDGRDGLVFQRFVARNAHLFVDGNAIVLDRRDTGHLD
jgi:hypothetical protein